MPEAKGITRTTQIDDQKLGVVSEDCDPTNVSIRSKKVATIR